jgi:sporulation protein YlmC with PRC-barrel domain
VDEPESALVWVHRSGIIFNDSLGDVRGRRIVTMDGEPIGVVDDMLVDTRQMSAQLLEIDTNTPDGPGRGKALVPVQLIERVDSDHIFLGCAVETVVTEPTYNPHVVPSELYLGEILEHFDVLLPPVPSHEAQLNPDAGGAASRTAQGIDSA